MESTITKYGPFEVDEFITPSDMKMVEFDPKNLDEAFSRNPGTIAYFGNLLGRAKRQVSNLKTRRDAAKSVIMRKLRDELTSQGKKPSEVFLEAEMRSNPSFMRVADAYSHALQVEQTLEALYWAARGRRNDMEFFASKERSEGSARAYRTGD